MSTAEEKDYVLTHIRDLHVIDLYGKGFLLGEENPLSPLFYKHQTELLHREYISVHLGQSEKGSDEKNVILTPAGVVFMNNGGYSLPEQKELKEERRKQLDWNWRRGFESISTFVSLTALIVATLTFSNTPKESDIKALRLQVDSLKHVKLSTTVTPPVSSTSSKKKP